jgi:NADH dehydrogenase
VPGKPKRVFVAGATGFIGYRVVRALLDEGAEVTALLSPEAEDRLGALRARVNVVIGDAWHPASLRGRARGHHAVINLIGGLKPDPTRGLTFRHLNFVSARNMAQMAVNDGVVHFVLLSAAGVPGLPSGYIESKREAERYVQKSGLAWTVVRASTLYARGAPRSLAGLLLTAFSRIPVVGLATSSFAPLSVDLAARGLASLALTGDEVENRVITARKLRKLGREAERRYTPPHEWPTLTPAEEDEPPFGWLPPLR